MQQTDKYQLNLIEASDTFSPAPLNENMAKLEAAIAAGDAAEAAARAADVAALDQRVQVLEAHKFVVGMYTGNAQKSGDSQFIDLGFTPKAVVAPVTGPGKGSMGVFHAGNTVGASSTIRMAPGGFMAYDFSSTASSSASSNANGTSYTYLAFA